MEEAGRTKTDAKGHFSFKLDSLQGPHLVRVIHQEVTYHRMAPPGTTSVEVEVYDVGKKIEGIVVVADIMRFQASQGQLQVERTFAVNNNSKPPRTQMNEHNLEFYVPDGATITEGQAMTAGGQPVKAAPVPEDNAKSRYAFLFPLRPGETRFRCRLHTSLTPQREYRSQEERLSAGAFRRDRARDDAVLPRSRSQLSSRTFPRPTRCQCRSGIQHAGGPAHAAFKLSGEGTLAAPADQGGESGQGSSAQPESRPGGGLGPPIDAPDPLQKYRW